MSLLIKALDSAEKTKQAEKDKKKATENTAVPVALELEPLDSPEPGAPESVLQDPIPTQASSQDLALTPSEQTKPANTLTLEEEAGLSNVPLAINKYAKTKSTSAKSPVPPLKGSLRETQNSAKPEPTPNPINATSPFQARPTGTDANQQTAAKVFVANQAVKSASSKYALLSLGVAGALILWLGLQGYVYFKPLFAPDVIVVKPPPPLPPEVAVVETRNPEPAVANTEESLAIEAQIQVEGLSNSSKAAERPIAETTQDDAAQITNAFSGSTNNKSLSAKALASNESIMEQSAPSIAATKRPEFDSEGSSVREPVKVTSKAPSPAVDPTLLSAYKAFTRGEDGIAQQQYRLVLQKDVRNIDALLGMAAIAQRQGRHADAVGWFQKVLEIEPRNSIARSAIINSQSETDIVGSESRLKSMLAMQPGAAHLHAALGNIYAEQNQWTLAQEAYFNASRFAPNNPDYAFNLAISLDQLGKADLALKQYQRALVLLTQSGATSPDRAQLEARIQALQ